MCSFFFYWKVSFIIVGSLRGEEIILFLFIIHIRSICIHILYMFFFGFSLCLYPGAMYLACAPWVKKKNRNGIRRNSTQYQAQIVWRIHFFTFSCPSRCSFKCSFAPFFSSVRPRVYNFKKFFEKFYDARKGDIDVLWNVFGVIS